VALDRSSIQRSDFPTVRRGYEPGAVDAHLRELADELEGMRRPGAQPVAAAASAQVQRIVEAAESTAEQLRTEAGEEAREHVHRVSTAARELLERIGVLDDELGSLTERLREDAGRLSAELRSLERDVGEVGAAQELAEPEPEPEPEAEPAAEPENEPEPPADTRPDDEEAARLVALDMALGGAPREETETYLAEHYALSDPGKLLDDVYALAGS
jgi:DivIVA domain-containing protein